MLGAGALTVAAAPALQHAFERVAQKDPTGLTGVLPNGGGFRYYSVAASVPHKSADTYRLKVDGLVETPSTYTLPN